MPFSPTRIMRSSNVEADGTAHGRLRRNGNTDAAGIPGGHKKAVAGPVPALAAAGVRVARLAPRASVSTKQAADGHSTARTRGEIAAPDGAVAVLEACWMHDARLPCPCGTSAAASLP